jgi:hypothetical protein
MYAYTKLSVERTTGKSYVYSINTVKLDRSDAKFDTWCCSIWHHEVSSLALMLVADDTRCSQPGITKCQIWHHPDAIVKFSTS